MKIAKMIFTILTILSVIAAAITALMFESSTIAKFSDAGLIFIAFALLAIACMGGVILTDNAIDIIESNREIKRGIEEGPRVRNERPKGN